MTANRLRERRMMSVAQRNIIAPWHPPRTKGHGAAWTEVRGHGVSHCSSKNRSRLEARTDDAAEVKREYVMSPREETAIALGLHRAALNFSMTGRGNVIRSICFDPTWRKLWDGSLSIAA